MSETKFSKARLIAVHYAHHPNGRRYVDEVTFSLLDCTAEQIDWLQNNAVDARDIVLTLDAIGREFSNRLGEESVDHAHAFARAREHIESQAGKPIHFASRPPVPPNIIAPETPRRERLASYVGRIVLAVLAWEGRPFVADTPSGRAPPPGAMTPSIAQAELEQIVDAARRDISERDIEILRNVVRRVWPRELDLETR